MILERGEDRILKILKSALGVKLDALPETETENASRAVTRVKEIFRNDINTNSRAVMGMPLYSVSLVRVLG